MERKTVKSIKVKEAIPDYVYNLRVKDNHNYFANNILLHNCDDPNNVKDGGSEILRETTNDFWDHIWPTRLNNPKTGCRIVVQQRVHDNDITGHIIKNDTIKSWVKLILPMEYEVSRPCSTVSLRGMNGDIWEDPRKKEGELLWPQRYGPKQLEQLKIDLGSEYTISGQLQQRPSPEAGGILKKSWFKWWKYSRTPQIEHVIQSWDTALEIADKNAFSCCTTWGMFSDVNGLMNLILLSMYRGRIEYPDLRRMAQRLHADYRDDDLHSPIKPDGHHVPDVVLIEAKVSGISLVQDMIKGGIPAIRFDPNRFGDKISRVRQISHLIESGRVWVPAKPPDFSRLRRFADSLVEHCALFPNGDSRDMVDTMSQVLLRLNANGWLSNNTDVNRGNDTSVRMPDHEFY